MLHCSNAMQFLTVSGVDLVYIRDLLVHTTTKQIYARAGRMMSRYSRSFWIRYCFHCQSKLSPVVPWRCAANWKILPVTWIFIWCFMAQAKNLFDWNGSNSGVSPTGHHETVAL